MLEYKLIRSKRRKTLSLQVRHGQVTVRAPHYLSTSVIDTFIGDKSAWLKTKIAEQAHKADYCDFTQGSILFFLGEKLRLNISTNKHASVFITSGESALDSSHVIAQSQNQLSTITPQTRQLHVVISNRVSNRLTTPLARAKQVKKQLELYFKQEAEQLIIERLEHISEQILLKATSAKQITKVSIRQYRARWGSCNSRGELSFNYLLIMAPVSVIDYVIIHELCHLTFLNHSKDFWQLVEQHCPNFKSEKKWLTNHQSQLSWVTPV